MLLRCMINGKQVEKDTEPTKRLLDFLREDCGLTGVKEGCSEGECGACTVLLDKKAVTSCTVFAGQVMGREITTIEGLEQRIGRAAESIYPNGSRSVRILHAGHDIVL